MSSLKSWISAFSSSLSISQATHRTEESQAPSSEGSKVDLESLENGPAKLMKLNNVSSNVSPTYDGRSSSFVFLVSGLERALDDVPTLIDQFGTTFSQREPVVSGASFTVERAAGHAHDESIRWKHILEIRALLHEPIRYHPNIVRLLGLSWGAARGSRSSFPLLVLEFSELGTLADLQANEEPLLFQTKKKLCYDVSKGISILHACGIVHGDLKHENVLIFPNTDTSLDIPYTAKLADFGGSMMDLDAEGSSLHIGTPPYDAPEFREGNLTADGMKKTDVYSLGLLIWRTFLNGENPFAYLAKEMKQDNEEELMSLKRSGDEVPLQFAKETIRKNEGIPAETLSTVEYALEHSLQENPEQRRLNHTIAGLQATTHSDTLTLLKIANDANTKDDFDRATLPPGHHGVSSDTIGLYLAKNGRNNGYYDYQKKGIGMPYLMHTNVSRTRWPLGDFTVLDGSIKEEFQLKGIDTIDEVYVNDKGYGLLHYAATVGNWNALRYLIEKYSPNIDIPNQHTSETPLLCACRSGHLNCALYLLDKGASPDGDSNGRETPLYWLCAFTEKVIPQIAARLVKAGGLLTNDGQNRGIRRPKFQYGANYEDLFCLPVSPLSRAVIMESLPAVRALLVLGADPLEQFDARSSVCPIVLAAVLMLPDILEVLLAHIDAHTASPIRIFDELEMLRIAMNRQATMQDPTAMLNRTTRCSEDAKVGLDRTLRILHDREIRLKSPEEEERLPENSSSISYVMSRLVLLGRRDIVRSLLELDYRTVRTRTVGDAPSPVLEAVKKNDELIFRLLDDFNVEAEYSPPGLFIANYLLDILGLPIEPAPSEPRGTRITPFAAAAKNSYFDLANLLLERGADMDHEERVSLASTDKSRCKADLLPKFVPGNIDSTGEASILHLVAARIPKTATQKRAIDSVTSGAGTALNLASLLNNLEVVSELVERGASLTLRGSSPKTPTEVVEMILSTYPHLADTIRERLGLQDNNRAAEVLVWRRYVLIWETLNSSRS
ncbi:hypothetical protein L218DRAFT_1001045 [Marasmius fiardii PR-910]|nr:hypothetical protein L218DRAFT_1001045 [Marasmius fiardii PR-910]